MSMPFPVSANFKVVTDSKEYASEESSVSIVNSSLQAGVFLWPSELKEGVPNPAAQGLIFLGNGEEAKVELSYEALAKLDEVVRSATEAARAIRVQCPIGGE